MSTTGYVDGLRLEAFNVVLVVQASQANVFPADLYVVTGAQSALWFGCQRWSAAYPADAR